VLPERAFFGNRRILNASRPATAGNRRLWVKLIAALALLWSTGCGRSLLDAPAAVHRHTPNEESAPLTERVGTPPSPSGMMPETRPSPQARAALELQQQARTALNAKRPETAIRILEQALALSPQNGANYYYLADAWLLKGDRRKAGEFNRLAAIYLRGQPSWTRRLERQRRRIQKARP